MKRRGDAFLVFSFYLVGARLARDGIYGKVVSRSVWVLMKITIPGYNLRVFNLSCVPFPFLSLLFSLNPSVYAITALAKHILLGSNFYYPFE